LISKDWQQRLVDRAKPVALDIAAPTASAKKNSNRPIAAARLRRDAVRCQRHRRHSLGPRPKSASQSSSAANCGWVFRRSLTTAARRWVLSRAFSIQVLHLVSGIGKGPERW
jgi:hypothetical protein